MNYYKNLYIGESIKEKKVEILKKLKMDKPMLQLYVITLAKENHNHLEFTKSLLWRESSFKEESFIVGLANDYEEAVQLIAKIVEEVYTVTNGVNIRKYICDKQQEE